jgi:hypothetical protein
MLTIMSHSGILSLDILYIQNGCWIYNYMCNQCLSPCEFKFRKWWGVIYNTLCEKVCQWLAAGWWCSPGTPVSSNNKTERHDITEALSTLDNITQSLYLKEYPMNDSGFLDFSTFIYWGNRMACWRNRYFSIYTVTYFRGIQIWSSFSTAEIVR